MSNTSWYIDCLSAPPINLSINYFDLLGLSILLLVRYVGWQSSRRCLNQIWLQVGEESRNLQESCYVLVTYQNLLSKYGNFDFFSHNVASLTLQASQVFLFLIQCKNLPKTGSFLGLQIYKLGSFPFQIHHNQHMQKLCHSSMIFLADIQSRPVQHTCWRRVSNAVELIWVPRMLFCVVSLSRRRRTLGLLILVTA